MTFPPGTTPEAPPKIELLRSLGRMVRGLSALFWGLPLALIACIECAKTDVLQPLNVLPPMLATGWIFYALCLMGKFHPGERVWIRTLNRCKELSFILFGLSPFLFWYGCRPAEQFFKFMTGILAVVALLFLDSLNRVIHRITLMLPDEGLREEARHFTSLNRYLLMGILLMAMLLTLLMKILPVVSIPWANESYILSPDSLWLLVFVALLPLAMTMALVWKIKEVILSGVFGGG